MALGFSIATLEMRRNLSDDPQIITKISKKIFQSRKITYF